MADEAENPAESAVEVRESIEAKATNDGNTNNTPQDLDASKAAINSRDASDNGEGSRGDLSINAVVDASAEAGAAGADAEDDADADGEPEEDRTPGRLDHDMLIVIENTANYLSTYRDAK